MKKIILSALCLTLLLTACGTQQPENAAVTATEETKTAQEYLDEENAILAAHDALWETVFASMSKNVTDEMLSSNYGDVLMAAVENVKDKFSDADYEALKADAKKIRQIEDAISALPPEMLTLETQSVSSFPAFTGKDLDGNDVDSSLFAENTFTVVNFWFSGCKPCVAEMAELEALSQRVREQGGELIGINTETLDGDAEAIAAAKEILKAKGVTYRNIYFDSASEAGQFAGNVMAFPTTYVIDRSGNVVGEPLLGGIDSESNLARLQQTIDQAIANS